MSGTTGGHASRELITAYVVGDSSLPADRVWGLEAHLENCPRCRRVVAETTTARLPAVDAVLDGLWTTLAATAVERPAPTHSGLVRRARTWAPPSQRPWLLMGVLVVAAAIGLDLLAVPGRLPSLVLLLAPVVPLAGVAAAWSGRLDPMGELTATTPRAGVQLVLRRTAAVLAVLIPALAAAGGITGVSLALCLLPCLAFTVGALALGTLLGVHRAAAVLGVLWTVAVVLPSLLTNHLPLLLAPASVPGWALAVTAAALVTALRARVFTTGPSTR
jgi:hypothetical protein